MSQENMTNNEVLPQATVIPTSVTEDGSSLQVGYTESDPAGPPPSEQSTLLAGKFKSPEELEKAYKELESKLGGQQQQQQQDPVDEADKVAAVVHTPEATSMLQERGLDIDTFTREFETTGQLSENSYAALEAKGITRDMVNTYISGQRVMVAAQVAEVKAAVGGEDKYQKLITWASSNLPPEDMQAYNAILGTNDLSIIKIAATGLKAKYDAVMGTDPRVVVGGSAPAGGSNNGIGHYENMAQMTADMRDARYASDPAFRERVMKKADNSRF